MSLVLEEGTIEEDDGDEEKEEGEADLADMLLLLFLSVSSSLFLPRKKSALGVIVEVVSAVLDADFCLSACTTLMLPPKPNHPLLTGGTFPLAAFTLHIRIVAARKSRCRFGIECRRRRGMVQVEGVAAGVKGVVDVMLMIMARLTSVFSTVLAAARAPASMKGVFPVPVCLCMCREGARVGWYGQGNAIIQNSLLSLEAASASHSREL